MSDESGPMLRVRHWTAKYGESGPPRLVSDYRFNLSEAYLKILRAYAKIEGVDLDKPKESPCP